MYMRRKKDCKGMRKKKTIVHKKKYTRHFKKSGNFNPRFFLLAVFIAGIILGVGMMYVFGEKKIVFADPYYSEDVFTPPKNLKSDFVLGENTRTYQIPILLYHYVEYIKDYRDTIRASLNIRRDIFEKQIQDLLKAGYTFLTVAQAGEIVSEKRIIPPKAVVLTFDDGYRDFYTDVFPILSFYKIKATVFIVSEFLNHANNLTNAQVKELVESGLVEIGGHTYNHLALTSLTREQVAKEIYNDKRNLEDKFGIKVTSFAYPYGIFDQATIDLVKAAGYDQAVSVVRGSEQSLENKFYMYRIRPGNATGEYLVKILEGD